MADDDADADGNYSRGRSWWMIGGLVVTVPYLGAVIWLLFINKPGGLIDRPATMPLNELGDFLAGVFAPLAFLWLFLAVAIQTQELALQRKELRLTRKGYDESRKLMKLQAEESRRQAEFVGTQTQILIRQHERRQREESDALFRELCLSLTDELRRSPLGRHQLLIKSSDGERREDGFIRFSYQENIDDLLSGVSGATNFSDLLRRLKVLCDRIEAEAAKRPYVWLENIEPKSLSDLGAAFAPLIATYPMVTEERRAAVNEILLLRAPELLDAAARNLVGPDWWKAKRK